MHQQFRVTQLIVPLGVATITSLLTTLALGFFLRKNRKRIFPWHRGVAVLTAALALTHAILVMIYY